MRRCEQTEIFIAQYARSHGGNFPTFDEMAKALKSSKGNAYKWIVELLAKGRLIHQDNKYWLPESVYCPPPRLADLIGQVTFDNPHEIDRSISVKAMYRAQKGLCWWCSIELDGVYQVDHRLPISKGGTDEQGNLCLSCPDCNSRKSDKMPWEFNGRLL